MDLDLRDLRYFQTIAELGHLGRAADQLGRSQPALTKCIHRLEETLGAELFERKGRGIQLTAVGEMLLTQTRRLRNVADTTWREMQMFAHGGAGRVRIGTGPVSADYVMPGICEMVLAQGSGISLEVTVGMNYVLREQLRSGGIDLIVGLVPDCDLEFVTHPLVEDVVVPAAGRSHPIFRKREPKIEDLADYGWVLPIQAVVSRQWLDRTFQAHGLQAPKCQIEVNSITMLPHTIARSELLCFTSRYTLPRSSPLKEIRIPSLMHRRRLGLTYSDAHLSPAVNKLIDLLRADTDWIEGAARAMPTVVTENPPPARRAGGQA